MARTPEPPRRGTYDRSANASERARQRRELFLDALEQELLSHPGVVPSAETLIRKTRLSRASFYSSFENTLDAVRILLQGKLQELPVFESQPARTPLSATEDFCRLWCSTAGARHTTLNLLADNAPHLLAEHLVHQLSALHALGSHAGLFEQTTPALLLECLAWSAVHLTTSLCRGAVDVESAASLLRDLVIKALR